MSLPSPSSHPRPWEEKSSFIAGILAYLVPGAGHLFQGRTAKGLIYLFSILGLFFWGQKMGEGMVVYNLPEKGSVLKYVSLSYAAQLGAGASALPAFLQNRRAANPSNHVIRIPSRPMVEQFEGHLVPADKDTEGVLVGTLRVEPVEGGEFRGTFEGTLDGKPAKLNLGGSRFELDPAIKAGFRREIICGIADSVAAFPTKVIEGTIPRPFKDAYASPPDADQLQEINGRLGKTYELAMVFTWIAGLLNVLAIWDCVLGPAYGFGDEHLKAKSNEGSNSPQAAKSSPTPSAPVSTSSSAPSTISTPPTQNEGSPPKSSV
jgi:hypothetical protein